MPETKQIHFDGKIISRNKGQSAVASAAYRSGEKIYFEREGITFDYTRKQHIAYSEIFLPENAPEAYRDRAALWNAVESFETTKTAQLARSIEFSLPSEIPLSESIQAAREMAQYYRDQGMCVDLNIHNPKGTPPNPHCHLMLTLRPFNEDGTFVRHKSHREYILDENGQKIPLPNGKDYKTRKVNVVDWDDKGNMEKWRAKWAEIEQKYLNERGHRIRVEHRSFKRQGIHRIPTIHMGPEVTAMERRGIRTRVGDMNREIKEINEMLEKYDVLEQQLDVKIFKIQRRIEQASKDDSHTNESPRPVARTAPTVASMLNEFQQNRDRFLLDRQIHQRLATKTKNLKEFASLYSFVAERRIETLDDLAQEIHAEKSVRREAIRSQHRIIDEQKKYAQLLDAAEAYKPYRKYYRKYESLKGKEKRKYRERYAEELEQAELRLKAIEHYSGKTLYQPSKWEAKLAELNVKRKEIDAQIRTSAEHIETLNDLADMVNAVETARRIREREAAQKSGQRHEERSRSTQPHSASLHRRHDSERS